MLAFWNRRRSSAESEQSEPHPCPPQPPPGSGKLLDQCLPLVIPAAACGEQCRPRDGERRRYFLYGIRPEPMPSHIGPVEPPLTGRLGIACSGGGIRSAAFNLGVLQKLQSNQQLGKADYVAAVSGGSYIAAAFALVSKRWPTDKRPRFEDPAFEDSDPEALREKPPFAPGSPEEQYIRNRSSYLAPSGSDKLFLGTRIALGLMWNLVFLATPLMVLGLLGGATVLRDASNCDQDDVFCEAVIRPGYWIAPVAIAGLGLAASLWGLIRRSPSDRHRQFFQAWSTRLLILGALVALLLVAVPALVNALLGSELAVDNTGTPDTGAKIGGVGGLAGLLAGLGAYVANAFSSPKALAKEAGGVRKAFSGLPEKLRKLVVLIAGAVLGPLLLFSALVFGASIALANSTRSGVPDGVWIAIGAGTAGFLLFYYAADVTSWSLHPFYKRRLASAFALKRVSADKLTPEEKDRVQLVPGVTEEVKEVGAALERDYDRTVPMSMTHQTGWPTLIVCAAANVSNPGATPPGRAVTSFTFSANAIGGPLIGGASMAEYEAAVGSGGPTLYAQAVAAVKGDKRLLASRRAHDLSLLAAVAMSGAAVSPSMGKMTNRSLRFLIALANVRLGVWLPNPRWVLLKEKEARCMGKDIEKFRKRRFKAFGRPRPWYLVQELLGRNRVSDRYLYVTDGGHYENLGLVELLRRGCTRIYCIDTSGSKVPFKDLGDAIALARSELDVHVYVNPRDLIPNGDGIATTDSVRGTFKYPDGTTGTLVYVHNVLTPPAQKPADPEADAPWDTHAYHGVDPNFPHDSTADQLYTDQRFEGYRVLGEVAGQRAMKLMWEKHPELKPPERKQ